MFNLIKRFFTLSVSLFFITNCYAQDTAEFDFHDHSLEAGKNANQPSAWQQSDAGIEIKITAGDDLYQDSSGLALGANHPDDLEKMKFEFFSSHSGLPINVVIHELRLKKFEPKVAREQADLIQLNGKKLAKLNASLRFNGRAGFGGDRHSRRSAVRRTSGRSHRVRSRCETRSTAPSRGRAARFRGCCQSWKAAT